MNKKEYSILLQDKRWKDCRMTILQRDGFKCRGKDCCNTTNLHVHHRKYIEGRLPWEVPSSLLITLCSDCHKKEHEGRPISSFVVKDRNNKNKQKKCVNKPKKKKRNKGARVFKMSGRDQILNERYKKLREEGKIAS